MPRRRTLLSATLGLTPTLPAWLAAAPARAQAPAAISATAPAASTEEAAQAARLKPAFLAFYPLYEMARLRHAALEDAASPRRGTLNALNHIRQLADHTARAVTTPNNDTLYSGSRIDLRHGPLLLELPAMAGRYRSLQLMNAYTDNVGLLGRSAGEGAWRVALVGPGWRGEVPPHSHRVDCDTHDAWLLLRTLVDGPADIAAVAALQDAMRLTAPRPAADYPRQAVAPLREATPALFLRVVNEMLQRNPPTGAMAEQAEAARALGVGAAAPEWAALPEATRQTWAQAWAGLQAALTDPNAMSARRVQGWSYPPAELGQWGGNYALRAAVALRGIGALDTREALYLNANVDGEGQALEGNRRYRLRVPPGGVPAGAFWSLSLYERQADGRAFFTANPIRRYAIGDRTPGLKRQPDGSIELQVQATEPAEGPSNWLPAPASGRFALTLRAYEPAAALVRGEAALPKLERLPDSAA